MVASGAPYGKCGGKTESNPVGICRSRSRYAGTLSKLNGNEREGERGGEGGNDWNGPGEPNGWRVLEGGVDCQAGVRGAVTGRRAGGMEGREGNWTVERRRELLRFSWFKNR